MKFSLASVLSAALLAAAPAAAVFRADKAVPWERLDKNDSLLIVLDIQEGLFSLARDWDPTVYKHNILAHGAIAQAFDLPVILSTSAEQGPNGRLFSEFKDMFPNAPYIARQGEVDAWDNEDFRNAVVAANKSQIIVAGITTDVCTMFLALSLRAEGYSVWANVEASGTTTEFIRDIANARMLQAGVQLSSFFIIATDLMRDWRAKPGAVELLDWYDKWYPAYGAITRSHLNAVQNGTVLDGEEKVPL
ncbi:isochorismatase [Thozetella sp. PMI_491]|nr:isochorismatase [Thozetella sp. PMI_491]